MPKRVFLCVALGFGIAVGLQYAAAANKKSSPGATDISIVHLKVEAEGAKCLLNLDTDRIDSPVTDILTRADQLQWYKQIGLDLICTQKKTSDGPKAFLEGINLKTAECKLPEKSDQRDLMGLSLANVRNMLKGVKPSSVIPQNAFVFETDTGRLGVLRVTNSDKNGITFQYKLAEDERKRLVLDWTERPKFGRPREPKESDWKLKTVRRFKAFDQMLKKNGFAVTPEQFPQIFTAYIPEVWDRKNALPPFITTDSAWETYHVLLEEGVKQIEQYQAVRLKRFSQRLLDRATSLAAHGQPDFARIAEYASIALALQDKKHAAMLPEARKPLLTALKEGSGNVRGPVGFPLSAAAFRANSFYTSSPKLANYFAARQWYAMVVFPAGDKDATSLAIRLTMLIDSDKEFRGLWDTLSKPYDVLLAKAEDGDVAVYASAIRKVAGPKATPAQAIESIEALQKHLQTALPDPQINDQLLEPKQYANFAKLIRGFRLLPPRRLTSSVCFQKTTPPGPSFPSALHFMVACKQMKSPAAVRALQQQVGAKRAHEIQQVDPGKLPDSLHGRAMKLIATLQKPAPENAPKAMKTQAWSDKQLWTQLGAWAQQRHTWALHAKMTVNPLGGPDPSDAGMVSPYPDFFESLGALARQTAAILPNKIDIKVLSKSLLDHVEAYTSYLDEIKDEPFAQSMESMLLEDPMLNRIHDLLDKCRDEHQTLLGFSARPSDARILKHFGDLARKCIEAGKASKQDTVILRKFALSGDEIVNLMGQFADICDKLASIARKQLDGKPLNRKENRLIRDYGPILARLHFYENFSCVVPRDDFPIISPIFVNPLAGRTLYAALDRPHALYVLGKLNGQTALMRGAVLGYREFTHPSTKPLDDEAWREMVWSGKPVPHPPAFTKSFIVHPDEDEIVEMLKRGETYSGIDNVPGVKITQAIIAMLPKAGRDDKSSLISRLHARCTEQDAPTLLKLMRQHVENPSEKQVETAEDIITLTAGTPCKAIAPELMQMLTAKNANHANAAAVVLFCQPNLIDASLIAPAYDKLSAPRRTLACFLLGRLHKPNQAAVATMLKALQDKNASLRWHGATALGRSGSKAPAVITALRERIDDSNDYVASASLDALTKLGATVDANILINKLKRYCRTPGWTEADKSAEKAIEAPRQGPFGVLAQEPFYIAPYPSHLDNAIVTALIQMKYRRAIPVILEIMTGDGFSSDYIGFPALKKLDRQGYPDRLLELVFNKKLDIDLRVDAMDRIPYCDSARQTCRKLIPLLSDKTPVSGDPDTASPKFFGDVAVRVIADSMEFTVDIITRPSEDGLFQQERDHDEEFKKLAKKVRKWAKTTTQPAGK